MEGFPLSPQQRHLWTLVRDQIGDSPYWSQVVVRINGPLDRAVLRSILDGLPARYEILRTTFFASEELSMPLQVIPPAADRAGAHVEDLSAADAAAQRLATAATADAMRATLDADPTALPFVTLTTLSADEHRLSIGVPALRCDRAGLMNLVADIARQYATVKAASTHGQADPADDVLQYADVSDSLNDILVSADTETGRQFWASKDLAGASTSRLPFEQQDGSGSPFAPRRVVVPVGDELRAAAARLAADRAVAIEIVALAAWQVLLQRTLGAEQIVVGYLSDGRSYEELRQAVGLFARSLPLSGELPNDVPFDDVMRQLSEAVAEATTWGESFDPRTLPQDRGDRTPFVRFAFERVDGWTRQTAHDVTVEVEDASAAVDRFALKLRVEVGDGTLGDLAIEYDSSQLNEADVTRLAAQLAQLLASGAVTPARAIGALDLLPAAQQAEILAFSGRPVDPTIALSLVHERFEAHAARAPESTAVVCEDTRLSYAQLNARANQLAHHLRALGVGSDRCVGLCLERSVDVAVGILGILKAGGAYVPLDPHLPPARLATLVDASRASVVVSRAALSGLLSATAQTVLLDNHRDAIEAEPTGNPATNVSPDQLVYVLFTSGSTGKPKGVAIEHRQLAHYVDAVTTRLELPPAAVFATVTTFAADLGNTSVYPALASGGCLHIVTEERAADPHAFADYVERHAIDVLKIVPSHLKALLSGARPERILPKQRLILGGEACSWELVDQVHALAPHCVVFNHYGPTETTIGATAYRVPAAGPRPPSATVPIGRPLDHARAYVVDDQRRLVPRWVAGELCIGGAGVARGYLTADETREDPFVSDRWAGREGARMYRTGDRVRLLPDGLLEFLGRSDHQIKIRGFRVEIGEVESALRKHPRVKDVAVLPHDDGPGTKLAAFLIYADTPWPQPAQMKTHLFEQGLPDYMAPASFVGVDALPLTSNGKLDRQRLLGFLALAGEERGEKDALTEWEALVADIWKELLMIDDVDPRDNFYDLGGHSLLAIQAVTALEKRAHVQVSPRDLVFHTLRQFAALCESKPPRTPASAANS